VTTRQLQILHKIQDALGRVALVHKPLTIRGILGSQQLATCRGNRQAGQLQIRAHRLPIGEHVRAHQLADVVVVVVGSCCGGCCVEAVEDLALVEESVYQGVVAEDLGAVFEEEPEEGGEAW